jgi:hypothetical protein
MRPSIVLIVAFLIAIASVHAPAAAAASGASSTRSRLQTTQDIGRETLPPNDGWASFSTFVDVLATYNAANDPDLSGDVGWMPTLHTDINAPQAVPGLVAHAAGPFHDD